MPWFFAKVRCCRFGLSEEHVFGEFVVGVVVEVVEFDVWYVVVWVGLGERSCLCSLVFEDLDQNHTQYITFSNSLFRFICFH